MDFWDTDRHELFCVISSKPAPAQRTTQTVLVGKLSPPLLMAFTRYSRRRPVGSFFRAILLSIAEVIWPHQLAKTIRVNSRNPRLNFTPPCTCRQKQNPRNLRLIFSLCLRVFVANSYPEICEICGQILLNSLSPLCALWLIFLSFFS